MIKNFQKLNKVFSLIIQEIIMSFSSGCELIFSVCHRNFTKMNVFYCLTLLAIVNYSSGDISYSIATAIGQIVNKVGINQLIGFQSVIFGSYAKKKRFEKVTNYFGKFVDIPLVNNKTEFVQNITLIDRSSILFYSSLDDYEESMNFTRLVTQHQSNLYFLTFIDDQRRMYAFLKRYKDQFVKSPRFFREYFIEFNRSAIILVTYELFKQPACNVYEKVVVNEFSIVDQKWTSENFTVEKFEDLNQCEVVIDAIYPQNLATQVSFDESQEPKAIQGYANKFNEIISKNLNFSFIFNPAQTKIEINVKEDCLNRTLKRYNESEGMLTTLQYEVSSFRKISRECNGREFTVTKGFTKVEEIILISRYSPYTMLDKVFLPFDGEVWFWLLGLLIFMTVVCAFFIYFTPRVVNDFVFGVNVNTPILNMM